MDVVGVSYEQAEEIGDEVHDALQETILQAPNTSKQELARQARDVVMRVCGHAEDEDDA